MVVVAAHYTISALAGGNLARREVADQHDVEPVVPVGLVGQRRGMPLQHLEIARRFGDHLGAGLGDQHRIADPRAEHAWHGDARAAPGDRRR